MILHIKIYILYIFFGAKYSCSWTLFFVSKTQRCEDIIGLSCFFLLVCGVWLLWGLSCGLWGFYFGLFLFFFGGLSFLRWFIRIPWSIISIPSIFSVIFVIIVITTLAAICHAARMISRIARISILVRVRSMVTSWPIFIISRSLLTISVVLRAPVVWWFVEGTIVRFVGGTVTIS